jgi:hypothetical protein
MCCIASSVIINTLRRLKLGGMRNTIPHVGNKLKIKYDVRIVVDYIPYWNILSH